MKRIIKGNLWLLIFALLFTACGDKNSNTKGHSTIDPATKELMSEPKLEHKDDLFEMKLHIEKTKFKAGEPIVYSATLTYIGNNKSIQIWGGQTYILFSVTDGKKINMEGVNTLELTSTVLNQGETQIFPFFKSGGYSANDPDAAFWNKFYSEKDLILPAGTYLISARCVFSLSEKVVDSRYNAEVHTTIIVE